MLRRVRSHDGATVTIYSEKVAIGGLTSAKNGHWYWALFGVNNTGLDEVIAPLEFGGVEQDVDSAFAALGCHWRHWLEAAGLICQTQDYFN